MSQIQVGDVVELKSGGPVMTVEKPWKNDMMTCVWIDKDGKQQRAPFGIATLKPFKPVVATPSFG